MSGFENEKSLIWCDRSNWHAGQFSLLKSSEMLILKFSPQF